MYEKVLLPVDLGVPASWRKALPTSIDVCRTYGGQLSVLTVVPAFGTGVVGQYFPVDVEKDIIRRSISDLQTFVEEHIPDDVKAKAFTLQGSVYREILSCAEEIGADLIVMGSHRPELADFLLGPNAARVVRHAACSVWVVRGDDQSDSKE